MNRWLILGQMRDLQTGLYIVRSIEELGYHADFIDTRALIEDEGTVASQEKILKILSQMKDAPDYIVVLKGLEMTLDTLKEIKSRFPKAKFLNWFFDVYLGDKKIWENKAYFEAIKLYDYFMCSLKGVADKLRDIGFDNAIYIKEGCYPPLHGEQYINNFQKKKYGSDVAFIGSVGMTAIHKNRVEFLKTIVDAGFDLKIWGGMVGEQKAIPLSLRHAMTNQPAINETHSIICQSSLVNIGIDQDTTIDESWSARMYRVMCAGGLYLTTPTRGIDKVFKTNAPKEDISPDQELVVYYSDADLVEKLDFLLEHDDIRESIANNGRDAVIAKHTFVHRIKEIIEVCKK